MTIKSNAGLVGRWFSIDGDQGIVRYVGQVDGAKGEWLGVEWDNTARGKHSGTKDGKQYFSCQKPGPCGSFIRCVERISWGQSLLSAVRDRYIVDINEVNQILPGSIDGHRGKLEAVGFDKIVHEQSNLQSLTVFGLDSLNVYGIGDSEGDEEKRETKELMAQAQTLTLAKNFLTKWNQVEEIIQLLPNLHTLDISANHFDHPLDVKTDQALNGYSQPTQIHTLRIDSSPSLEWSDVAFIAQQLALKTLSFGWSKLSSVFDSSVQMEAIEELHLAYNEIADFMPLARLPRLRLLNLSGNKQLASIPRIGTDMFRTLESLNISSTNISAWQSIENLAAFPHLCALYAVDIPLPLPASSQADGTGQNPNASINSTRAHIIGRIGNLTKLDGTLITQEERIEMERYYLSQCANAIVNDKSAAIKDGDGDSVLVQLMVARYPRVEELVTKHGVPRVAKPQENKLKSRLIKVTIEIVADGDGVEAPAEKLAERSLIRTMQVRQLTPVIMRLGKIQQAFALYAGSADRRQWVKLDSDTRPLSHFGLESGSVIRVVRI
ncbi:hypothetical protein GGI12_001310 [Dipsacomyces acuminosporus]|nr:hypothetical protein GGI12_001310 [Dipsacomyces acuminosporus]